MMNELKIKESYPNSKAIKPNTLIALCELGDDYKLFCEDLEKLLAEKGNNVNVLYMTILDLLYGIGDGPTKNKRKYKSFIDKYAIIFDIMHHYKCLEDLTCSSYDEKGKRKDNLPYDYFYQYLQEHPKDIETIQFLAKKIKNLGFENIIFGEKIDFTKLEYEFEELLIQRIGKKVAFLENMEADPTYLNNPIKYHSNGSSYCLFFGANYKKINMYGSSIVLNSLTFDPCRLPNELTLETTVKLIQELPNKKKDEYTAIQNSINLSIKTNALEEQLNNLQKLAESFEQTVDRQELMNILLEMQTIIKKLQQYGSDYENKVINSYPDITAEKLTIERTRKIHNREWSIADYD